MSQVGERSNTEWTDEVETEAVRRVSDDALLVALIDGGDERTASDPRTGRNRYFANPLDGRVVFNRGSCTAGMINARSNLVAREFLDSYDSLNYASLVEEQALRLKQLLASVHNDPIDVFFGPSGTDLVYWPVLFQRLLHPGKEHLQLISCPEELGSGSLPAASGRLFARENQFGEAVDQGAPIDPTMTDVRVRSGRPF